MEKNNGIILPDTSKLIVSSSPHLHDGSSINKIMLMVIIALLPSAAMGVYFFGFSALIVLLVSVFSALFFEFVFCKLMHRPNDWKDGSAIITGLLLGMLLSAGIPWWVCIIGSFLAIVFGKQLFGGIGNNPFNPACMARIALLIGFPKLMTTWVPSRFMDSTQFIFNNSILSQEKIEQIKSLPHLPFFGSVIDGVTSATPLNMVKTSRALGTATNAYMSSMSSWESIWNYFIGNVGGCIGETSAIALIAGGIFLICMKIIRWQIPVVYIGTVAVFGLIVHIFQPSPALPGVLFQVTTGGLLLGAFFMATDMVTTPMNWKGGVIFAFGCGIITCVIRDWGGYPEGVMFAIILMNAFTPLIDRITAGKPFGFKAKKKLEEGI